MTPEHLGTADQNSAWIATARGIRIDVLVQMTNLRSIQVCIQQRFKLFH